MEFGELKDVDLRTAWPDEAGDFTPWLADNLERLSRVIGIPLETEGTEVAVEGFAADILAVSPMNNSKVLIENQLEITDHRHLGQILTYRAGLEAQTIVWVARQFHEAHLSAIRWLNEHTDEPFAFLRCACGLGALVTRPHHQLLPCLKFWSAQAIGTVGLVPSRKRKIVGSMKHASFDMISGSFILTTFSCAQTT